MAAACPIFRGCPFDFRPSAQPCRTLRRAPKEVLATRLLPLALVVLLGPATALAGEVHCVIQGVPYYTYVDCDDSRRAGPAPLQLNRPGDLLERERRAQDAADRDRARQLIPLVYGATARTQSELIAAVGGPDKFAAIMRTPEGRAAVDWWERHHEKPVPHELPILTFTSQLDGVELWLDDKRLGELRLHQPLVAKRVSVGNRRVRATKAGYPDWGDTIEVTANERSVIDVDLLGSGPQFGGDTRSSMPAVSPGAAVASQEPRPVAPVPGDTPTRIRKCRSEATEVAGTADETEVWRRAFQVCVKRAGLVPLSPEAAGRVRALVACKSETTEAENTEAWRQQIRLCMERREHPAK